MKILLVDSTLGNNLFVPYELIEVMPSGDYSALRLGARINKDGTIKEHCEEDFLFSKELVPKRRVLKEISEENLKDFLDLNNDYEKAQENIASLKKTFWDKCLGLKK